MTSDHTVAFTWHELPATRSYSCSNRLPSELARLHAVPQTKHRELHALLLPAPGTAPAAPAAPASTVLPVLARGFSSLPVLHFRIQAFGRYASRRAFLIKTLRLRLRYIGHHPLERNVHHRRHKGPQQLIHFRARRRIAVRKIRVRDLNAVHRNQMFVIVDVCRARHGRGANHLLAAVGSQLKRLAPDDCGEVLLVIHLRLVRDKSSACLHILARPPGILGDDVGTRKQTDHENSCSIRYFKVASFLHQPHQTGIELACPGTRQSPARPRTRKAYWTNFDGGRLPGGVNNRRSRLFRPV